VLDLGCGNGGLAKVLADRAHSGGYLGIDAEGALLDIARQGAAPSDASWLRLDLGRSGWWASIDRQFDVICAFAVLHHLPGNSRRIAWAEAVRRLVAPGGWAALSVWDFLALDDADERIVPWEAVGLSRTAVEPGDYLVDWRRGGSGVRYVHHFAQDELTRLAEGAGFQVVDHFRSDGHGGKLSLYQIWAPDVPREGIL
jgi:SAM-dependent methyltransferase